jgi:hypothetical protein
MQANDENFDVCLGPSSYLEQQNFSIEPDDFLEIEGRRTGSPEQPTLMAFKVIKGDQVLTLRNPTGTPRWRAATSASLRTEALTTPEAK